MHTDRQTYIYNCMHTCAHDTSISFISDIEKIFHQWGLVNSDPTDSDAAALLPSPEKQHRKSERVTYAGRTFVVTLEVGGAGRGRAKRSKW